MFSLIKTFYLRFAVSQTVKLYQSAIDNPNYSCPAESVWKLDWLILRGKDVSGY